MLLALALLVAAEEIPPPRGVNDSVIGTAEQYRTAGPARVCLIHTTVDLRPDETAYLDYLGIHWGGLRVVGPTGSYMVREGDIWANPRHGGETVPDRRGRAILRLWHEGRLHYLIYGPNGERPLVRVEGDGLGRSRDLAILRRIQVSQADMSSCRRRFVYGWETILDDSEN